MHPGPCPPRSARDHRRAGPAVLVSALVAAPTDGGSDVGCSGPLTVIGGDCVGLGSPDDEETSVLVFPHGTRPSEDGRTIVLPDGVRLALGDPITAGGGSTTLRLHPDAFTPWPDAPSGCAGATYLTTVHDVRAGDAAQG